MKDGITPMPDAGRAACPDCNYLVPDNLTSCPSCGATWGSSTRDIVGAGPPSTAVKPSDPLNNDGERYTPVTRLGAGGMGTVTLSFDNRLRREVALKALHSADQTSGVGCPSGLVDPEKEARFIAECQAGAQLEHPCIVPIYDMGRRPDGHAYFTMKAIKGKSLKQLIAERRDSRENPTLFRLLQVLHQVSQAVAYMHAQGVLHRDLKPDNIMTGQFGEVYVVDFGLAKVRSDTVHTVRTDAGDRTSQKIIQGTPAYMAPEQIMTPDAVDEMTDLWALGAIMFEILTSRAPYAGSEAELWGKAVACDHPRPRDLDPDVPERLEQICLKAMARKKYDRHRSVLDFTQEIQEFLDGHKDLERRREIAAKALKDALDQLRRYQDFEREEANLRSQLAKAVAERPRTPTPEEQRRVDQTAERCQQMAEQRELGFTETVRRFVRAVDVSPDNRRVKEMLSDLAMERFLAEESAGNKAAAKTSRMIVELYHEGKYANQLRGDGAVVLSSSPPGAHVYLATFVEHGSRITPENERYLGSTPTDRIALPMGSYLATFRKDGYPDTLFPFLVGRNESLDLTVQLLPPAELAPNFVYIPEGRFLRGGDPLRSDAQLTSVHLAGYCIAVHPVTFGEYMEFLDHLAASEGIAAADKRAPRSDDGARYLDRDDTLPREVPSDPSDGAGVPIYRFPPPERFGAVYDLAWPIMGISPIDAEAFCAWRGARDGRPYRLPTNDEWEKAARGADGRVYPWGNRWVNGLSHNGIANSAPHPEPIRRRPSDVSPFGVAGVAGNVRDWTADSLAGADHLRAARGGCFQDGDVTARIAVVVYRRVDGVHPAFGFRMVYTPAMS